MDDRARPGKLIYLTIARDAGVWGAMQGSMERFKKEGIRPGHRRQLRNPGVRTVGDARKATDVPRHTYRRTGPC